MHWFVVWVSSYVRVLLEQHWAVRSKEEYSHKHYRKASSKFRNHTGENFKQLIVTKKQEWRHSSWRVFFNEYYIMENEEFRRVLVHGRLSSKSHFYQPLSLIHAKEAKNAAVNQRNVTVFFFLCLFLRCVFRSNFVYRYKSVNWQI